MLLQKRLVGYRTIIDPDTRNVVIEPLYEIHPVRLV